MPDAPLLPVPNRTHPFWLTEPDYHLQNHRTTSELPANADIVIVGSGLSGVLTAYHLFERGIPKGKKVVMIEADEFCSGATARNGGHCKPTTYYGFHSTSTQFGSSTADEMLRFEESHLDRYVRLVEKESIDCDLHVTRAVDVFFDQAEADTARSDFERRRREYPGSIERGDVRELKDPEELRRISGVKGGVWGVSYPAGHLWPYKLACGLAHKTLSKGLNLQTKTPVLSVSPSSSEWKLTTSRGTITTPQLILASNAYTAGILPEFSEKIIPVRGTACSITPPRSHLPGSFPGPLKYTYGLRFKPGESDYLIPRQGRGPVPGKGDRTIVLGGAKGCFRDNAEEWYGNWRDDQLMPGAKEYFEGYMQKHFDGWEGDERNVDRVWSGVLGYSSDLLPFVGEHPTKKGIFILAGFTGHGMPRIPGCAEFIADLVSSTWTGSVSPEALALFKTQVPGPYLLCPARMKSEVNLIKAMMGTSKTGHAQVDPGLEGFELAKRMEGAKL